MLPQVNLGTILLVAVAAVGGAWAAGLLRPRYEDGCLTLRILRAGRVLAHKNVEFAVTDAAWLAGVVKTLQERAKTLVALAEASR